MSRQYPSQPKTLAGLERERKAHVMAQPVGDDRSPIGHSASESGMQTTVNAGRAARLTVATT